MSDTNHRATIRELVTKYQLLIEERDQLRKELEEEKSNRAYWFTKAGGVFAELTQCREMLDKAIAVLTTEYNTLANISSPDTAWTTSRMTNIREVLIAAKKLK